MSDPLVSTDWLAARLGSPDVQILDASWFMPGEPRSGVAEHRQAHIPGAVFFDIDAISDTSSDLPHMLPGPEVFAAAAGALGLRRETEVVVYDSHGVFSAPRVWWTLRVMGFPRVGVLDGGLKAWRAEGRPLESGEVRPPTTELAPMYDAALVRSLDAVREATGQVVDARPAPRFRGEAPEPRPGLKAGHMPGARNVPWNAVMNGEGKLKAPDDLAAIFAAAGVDPDAPVIASCGSGVTAAVLALALARLGHDRTPVYDGSWAEWGGRGDTPVVVEPFIRLAAESDLPLLPEIELSAAETFRGTRHDHAGALAHFTPADDWREIQAAGTLWVMDDGAGRPIAFLAAEPGDDGALHVDEFDVEQGHQGKGLGRRMMTHVIEWARGAGYPALTLTTFNDIPWNGPFYATFGFRTLGPAELPPRIAGILAEEQARHLLGSRCAMRLDLRA